MTVVMELTEVSNSSFSQSRKPHSAKTDLRERIPSVIRRMPRPHDLCARIQNAFRARHQRVAVAHTTQNLGILSILLRAGFLSNVTRGTVEVPSPQAFHEVPEPQKRIWADLKYRDERPVLNEMHLISLPSRKIHMTPGEILLLCSGRRVQRQPGLRLGEIAVVRTEDQNAEWLEAREALRLNLGGEVICRVW